MNFDGCTIYLFNANMLNTIDWEIETIKDSAKPMRDTIRDKKH